MQPSGHGYQAINKPLVNQVTCFLPRGGIVPGSGGFSFVFFCCMLATAIASVLLPLPLASAADVGEITSADVMVQLSVLRSTVEILRVEMGKPQDTRPLLVVEQAEPREVYYQSLSLFEKANRLSQEHTRQRSVKPAPPRRKITPADVHQLLKLALSRLDLIRKQYNIPGTPQSSTRDAAHTPSDVYAAVVQINRQLNVLLERQVAPADVYQQVTQASGYAGALLETLPDADVFPEAAAYQRGKTPLDVYNRLAECYRLQRKIAALTGGAMVKIKQLEKPHSGDIVPGDVYDLASQLIAELAYLHKRTPRAQPANVAYYPGRKFPSHVYQRASILKQQLEQLEAALQKKPDLLKLQK